MKESKNNQNEDTRREKRNALLAALAKAGGETLALTNDGNEPAADNNGYYTMTRDEVEALVNGNIEKIEGWVSNLDRHHATWLLRWLIKESG